MSSTTITFPISLEFNAFLDDKTAAKLARVNRTHYYLMKNFTLAKRTLAFIDALDITSTNYIHRNWIIDDPEKFSPDWTRFDTQHEENITKVNKIMKAINENGSIDDLVPRKEDRKRIMSCKKELRIFFCYSLVTKTTRVGNCTEMTAIAFEYLTSFRNIGSISMGFIEPKIKNEKDVSGHVFVVIGDKEETQMVCDVWARKIYRRKHILFCMYNYKGMKKDFSPILRKIDLKIDNLFFSFQTSTKATD